MCAATCERASKREENQSQPEAAGKVDLRVLRTPRNERNESMTRAKEGEVRNCWGWADSETFISEGISKHDYVP